RPQPGENLRMLAVDLEADHEMGRVSDLCRIDDRDVAGNNAVRAKPLEAALNGGGRQADPVAQLGGRQLGVLLHDRKKLAVESVERRQRALQLHWRAEIPRGGPQHSRLSARSAGKIVR